MPWDDLIIGLPDFEIVCVKEKSFLEIHVRHKWRPKCHKCQSSDLRKKDRFERRVRHVSFGERLTELLIEGFKFYCRACRSYFRQRFPGILPRKRASEPFRKQVSRQHHEGLTQKSLARTMALGQATVERWYRDFIRLEHLKTYGAACPAVLGIDEHFFTRKKGYATTFVDLRKRKVFDVQLGRSRRALEGYLKRLRGRERVRVVVMDLAETYRSIVKAYFPNAKIVADRFHVIRLVNHHFLAAWKQFDPQGRLDRGLISLMRRHGWHLKETQPARLRSYFARFPAVGALYAFKQELVKLLLVKTRTKLQCRPLVHRFLAMLAQLRASPIPSMKTLGDTIHAWSEEIVRMWRFTKTNSITEGLHNKMEMITRRAYGMRNFENYRLRVRVHCGY
jgi:transposase